MISHFAAYIHTKIIKSLSFFFKDEGKGSTRGYLFTFTILRSIMYDTVVGLSLIYVVMNFALYCLANKRILLSDTERDRGSCRT